MAVIISARGEHWYDVPIEEARHGLSFFQMHLLEDAVLGNSFRDFPGYRRWRQSRAAQPQDSFRYGRLSFRFQCLV
jgi:hypothetical protein